MFLLFKLRNGLPAVSIKISDLAAKLQHCYQLTTAGKFPDVISKMRKILYYIPMLVVDSKQEVCPTWAIKAADLGC